MSVSIDELWSTILEDKSSSATSSIQNKRVLVLGDNLSGKRTLIKKICADEKDEPRGHGLGYDYINVTSNEEELGTLSIFTVDPSAPLRAQFKAALPDKASLDEAMIVIAVDLTKPWNVIPSLERWVKEIMSHRDEWLRLDGPERGRLSDKLQEKWMKAAQCEELTDITLTENLGVEIVVAALKADSLQTTLNDEGMNEQHADYLQFLLRQQSIRLGACLVYCSVKDARTVDTIKAYMLQNLFKIESDILTPRGVSREALFLPMGWDNEKRINLLKEGPELPDEISQPKQRSVVHEQELTAEDEQQALLRVEQILETTASRSTSGAPGQVKGRLPSVQSPQLPRPSVPNSVTAGSAASPANRSSMGSTPGGTTVANERMLADFFNQLLLKKGPSGSTPKGAAAQQSTTPTNKSTPKS